MKTSLPIFALFILLLNSCIENKVDTPAASHEPDLFELSERMTLELTADKDQFRLGQPMEIKGLAVNHSKSKESPFVMVPGGELHNLIFTLQNLQTQEQFLFSDFHLQQANAMLSGEATNLRMAAGDTVNAFKIDLQRLDGFSKSYKDADDQPITETFVFAPKTMYQLFWTVNGAAHTVSRPFVFWVD
jgi:hypothetical protein